MLKFGAEIHQAKIKQIFVIGKVSMDGVVASTLGGPRFGSHSDLCIFFYFVFFLYDK
jgi:hypothetical protein